MGQRDGVLLQGLQPLHADLVHLNLRGQQGKGIRRLLRTQPALLTRLPGDFPQVAQLVARDTRDRRQVGHRLLEADAGTC